MPLAATGAIDLHAHWTPPALADALRRRSGIPRITVGAAGEETYHSIHGQRPFTPLEHDLDQRIALMDRHGVGMQVLSFPGLFGIDCLPADEALPLLQLFNNAAARACRDRRGRFLALAAVPHRDMALACHELQRACDQGLRGVILPADAFASLDTAERFKPLLALAHALHGHVFVHPGPLLPPGPRPPPLADDVPWLRHIVLATQARLSEAMATLTLTPLLDPYPELTVQVANLGGAMAFHAERIDEVSRVQLHDPRPVAPRLRRCVVDTSSFGPRAIAMAVACFGADRVVLGTDCPIFDTPTLLAGLQAAAIDDGARALVQRGNAARLFGLATASTTTTTTGDTQ